MFLHVYDDDEDHGELIDIYDEQDENYINIQNDKNQVGDNNIHKDSVSQVDQ